MTTECTPQLALFQDLGRRKVVGAFDGGDISSEGGALLLRELERSSGVMRRFAGCFKDKRDPDQIEHSVRELVAQRLVGLTLGYEDLNDHDELRRDPLLAVVVGKLDPTGQSRRRDRDRGKALAGKSTLNRLELTPPVSECEQRYKKIWCDTKAVDRLLVDLFVDEHAEPPDEIVLDLDATDDPIHGEQEGRFFHGYYGAYCYLPLYIFCGEFALCARLRRSNIDASEGSLEEVIRIIEQIRKRWPTVRITLRADSGFARDDLMSWCEENEVHFVFGLAKNRRLNDGLADALEEARVESEKIGAPVRRFQEITYRTRNSWSRSRRVVGKAEHLVDKSNPRFIVTSIPKYEIDTRELYEDFYCARGDMENRIKEQQLGLFADRTSTHEMFSNQLRLYFSTLAYTMLMLLRRKGLQGTELAKAQCTTIRLKMLKIGALIRISVRRVVISLSSAYPYAHLFARAQLRLQSAIP